MLEDLNKLEQFKEEKLITQEEFDLWKEWIDIINYINDENIPL